MTVSALIIAPPGQLRDGLYTLLKAVPQITTICQVHDVLSVLTLDKTCNPALAVLDADMLQGELLGVWQQVRERWPLMRSIALVESEQQRQPWLAAAVDVVLVEGVLATRLLAIIEQLIVC
jgi:DNA-binding NarL/FixJ family response regulator